MAEVIAPYALTTVARIKDRLQITVAGFDTTFLRLISNVTDFIESQCQRRFKSTTYTNEVYSIGGDRSMTHLVLRQSPVTSLTSFQYRAGTPSTPSWTDFVADDYELCEGGQSGMIRIYGGIAPGTNQLRATYVAGYLIDFANAGTSTHTLPFDLTELCEELVIKLFKRIDQEGKSSISFNGSTINLITNLTDEQKMVIDRYRRLPWFA